MGLAVFQRLDVVINLHRHHSGLVGNIAADHQHHAEFADGMGKTEDAGRQKPGLGQRQGYREKPVQRPGAGRCGGFQRSVADGNKGVLQRLHHERQRIQHRRRDQSAEAERQGADAEPLGEFTDRAGRPHQHQQIKPQHGGRQHQRQSHDAADRTFPARTCPRQHQPTAYPAITAIAWPDRRPETSAIARHNRKS